VCRFVQEYFWRSPSRMSRESLAATLDWVIEQLGEQKRPLDHLVLQLGQNQPCDASVRMRKTLDKECLKTD